MMLWLALAAAFEFMPATGRAGSMLAGAAIEDWRNSFSLNPALVRSAGRLDGGFAYSRPYGLEGLDWAQGCLGMSLGRWSGGLGLSSMSFARYRETNIELEFGAEPVRSVALGLGIHALVVDVGRGVTDVATSFDVGASWQHGIFGLAAAGSAVNGPKFDDGDAIPMRLVLAGSLRPVEQLQFALDLSRTGSDEALAFGMEFNLVPPLDLRVGIGYEPLFYGAGVGIHVGPVTVDYAYRFHPQLKETHIIGLEAAWR